MRKIDELAQAVHYKHCLSMAAKKGKRPNLVIYMEHSYYNECMSEISGEVSMAAEELFRNNTIHGYPVYLCHGINSREGYNTPPPFTVVELGE